jgi:hypothetical protein
MNDQIEIVLAEATDSLAHLVIRAAGEAKQICGLTGSLAGPECRYARTLPSSYALSPLATSAGLLAELVLPDPCFWTPEMPLLYRLDMQLRSTAGETHAFSRLVGIRRWSVDRTALWLDGRRTVLRGVYAGPHDLTEKQLVEAHAEQLTLIAHQPDAAFCEAASRIGVALVTDLRGLGQPAAVTRELVRASHWPAVLMALVEVSQVAGDQPLPAGLMMVHPLDTSNGEMAPWSDGVLVATDAPHALPDWLAEVDKPVLALRRGPPDMCLATVRQACDRLQADLAPRFDLAGYFVGL